MSKLAHSDEKSMRDIEIRSAWQDLPPDESCETFAALSADPIDDVERLCGKEAFTAYMRWIQVNLK